MCKFVNNTKHSKIDRCMMPLIKFLRKRNYDTVACCCGHGKYPITVVVEFVVDGKTYFTELLTDTYIPRKRRFYRKDKEGYYYIPEVEDG